MLVFPTPVTSRTNSALFSPRLEWAVGWDNYAGTKDAVLLSVDARHGFLAGCDATSKSRGSFWGGSVPRARRNARNTRAACAGLS